MVVLQETSKGIVVEIKVIPNSPKFKVKTNSFIKVYLTSEPKRGKANKELINMFKKIFGVEVKILSGARTKTKKLLLPGLTKQDFIRGLSKLATKD
ncbi:MAG: YggU family protein [Candidatus Aenigmarchaeota archaeon]|nr:YggU family protein [Candidatus Aenigmarchaeota archaeon]